MYVILLIGIFLQFSLNVCERLDYIVCPEINFKGFCRPIRVDKNHCYSLARFGSMKSINGKGNCARIYENENCDGLSKFIRINSPSHFNLENLGFHSGISSVSQCFQGDECESSKSCETANKKLITGYNSGLSVDKSDLKPPIQYYQTVNDHTEVVAVLVEVHHMETGTSLNNKTLIWARSKGREDDEAGYIIPKRFGGSGTDLRNIFPQSKNFNAWEMENFENDISETIETKGKALITVNLIYNSLSSTRPSKLVYRLLGDRSDQFSTIVQFLNP